MNCITGFDATGDACEVVVLIIGIASLVKVLCRGIILLMVVVRKEVFAEIQYLIVASRIQSHGRNPHNKVFFFIPFGFQL